MILLFSSVYSIFTETGLSSYFLIVQDILQYARKSGYLTGPGRGSAAGCIVSYLMDITQIDPIPYNLPPFIKKVGLEPTIL